MFIMLPQTWASTSSSAPTPTSVVCFPRGMVCKMEECCRCNSIVYLLKSSPAVGAERPCGPCRTKLQGSLYSEYGTSSQVVLLTRGGTAESWSLTLGSNLTGCCCGKNGVVIAARALSYADVFAISAPNFWRVSSCFTRNFFSLGAWHFSSMAILASNSATLAASLALAIVTDAVQLPRELARLESFETLEAFEALDAFDGSGALAQLTESSGFTTESTRSDSARNFSAVTVIQSAIC